MARWKTYKVCHRDVLPGGSDMEAVVKRVALPRIPLRDAYTVDWKQFLSFSETEGLHPLAALQEFVS